MLSERARQLVKDGSNTRCALRLRVHDKPDVEHLYRLLGECPLPPGRRIGDEAGQVRCAPPEAHRLEHHRYRVGAQGNGEPPRDPPPSESGASRRPRKPAPLAPRCLARHALRKWPLPSLPLVERRGTARSGGPCAPRCLSLAAARQVAVEQGQMKPGLARLDDLLYEVD